MYKVINANVEFVRQTGADIDLMIYLNNHTAIVNTLMARLNLKITQVIHPYAMYKTHLSEPY